MFQFLIRRSSSTNFYYRCAFTETLGISVGERFTENQSSLALSDAFLKSLNTQQLSTCMPPSTHEPDPNLYRRQRNLFELINLQASDFYLVALAQQFHAAWRIQHCRFCRVGLPADLIVMCGNARAGYDKRGWDPR